MSRTLVFFGLSGNLALKLIELIQTHYDQIIGFDQKPNTTSFEFVQGDIADTTALSSVFDLIRTGNEVHVAHFISLLSGGCEQNHDLAMQVNVLGASRVFELCAAHSVKRILFPSSLAIFGDGDRLPNPVPERYESRCPPIGLYGQTKKMVMDMGQYYAKRYGIDFRCLVLPMVLSPDAPPGAASAYASRAFVEGIRGNEFTFPVSKDTGPSLVFLDDAIDALAKLMLANTVNQGLYQIHGFSATAREIAAAIHRRMTAFQYEFKPDKVVDALMRSWPKAMESQGAVNDLKWSPKVTNLDAVFEAFRTKMSGN